MTSAAEGLHAAALVLEEDVRKIDAGELEATPAQRAFLVGAIRGMKPPGSAESGGLPVDAAEPSGSQQPRARQAKGLDDDRPENFDLADADLLLLDGGRAAQSALPKHFIDGGKP